MNITPEFLAGGRAKLDQVRAGVRDMVDGISLVELLGLSLAANRAFAEALAGGDNRGAAIFACACLTLGDQIERKLEGMIG